MKISIVGAGKAEAEKILTNDELSHMVDTSDEWIETRTGIKTRHIAVSDTASSLATKASRHALLDAGIDICEIGFIISATMSGECIMPSVSCNVGKDLGAVNATCFDVNGACSGFIYAMITGGSLLENSDKEYALIIGSEVLSNYVNWEDRGTCILFGDGAGAVVIKKEKIGVTHFVSGFQADVNNVLTLTNSKGSYINMEGTAVYKFAIEILPSIIKELAQKAGIDIDDIDGVIAHQANFRIIESAAKKTGMPLKKWYMNLDKYGNTSAASIPMAICDAKNAGFIKKDDKIVMAGFGGGLTYGGLLINWN